MKVSMRLCRYGYGEWGKKQVKGGKRANRKPTKLRGYKGVKKFYAAYMD